MAQIAVNGIQLEYEVTGDPGGPPILLIMGLGAQLTRWPEAFVQALTDTGHRVIRFDNRDVGLSTRFDHAGPPLLVAGALRSIVGLPVQAPYRLDDLARDALGLLDALGIASAHVVGASMGGMVAQILAAQHHARVRTLVSIMSNSGSRRVPQPNWRLRLALLRRPTVRGDRERAIEATMNVLRQIASPGYPPDPAYMRSLVARDYDRSYYPRGIRRQLLAIMASGSRGPILGQIKAPTLILHGAEDPLIPVGAAHDLHRRIPGAQLQIFPGMGHDMPRALIPAITAPIVEHVRRSEAAGRGGSAAS